MPAFKPDINSVSDGRFGAMMSVSLTNEGPVTLTIDSRKFEYTPVVENNSKKKPANVENTAGEPLESNISTTFYPGSAEAEDSDLVLASSDGVYFFVHRTRLLAGSSNLFAGLLPLLPERKKVEDAIIPVLTASPLAEDTSIHDPTIDLHSISSIDDLEFPLLASDPADKPPEVIALPLQSTVLNIVLHVIYGLTMERFQPDLQLLCHALSELVTFGYRLADLVTPHSEIFHLLVAHSKTYPLVVYALAAGHRIERLAVSCSANTLGVELSEVTDELASVMGPSYLRRLFFLHLGRTDALKRLLLEPPNGHPPSPVCDLENQKSLTRAWALAIAYMTVEGRPNTHPTMLSNSLSTLGDHLDCPSCRLSLADRIRSVVQQWAAVSSTI
ncbi:hypothetical protein FRC07_006947 [Ceratobasidium sp. 392]|nr:hypothetical protein FRC07_006947 [Ceratobasidium sp. 392]